MKSEKSIYVKLYLGEQDGYEDVILTENGRWPDFFFVHPLNETPQVQKAEREHADDKDIVRAIKDALATLCYEFTQADPKAGVTGGKQYLYTRCPAHDRVTSDPAAEGVTPPKV